MRDPHTLTAERIEAAIEDACNRLRPLATMRSWSIVNWNDPDASDPRDEFQAAVEFVIALLDPGPPCPGSIQLEKYDPQAQRAADEFLGAHASLVRSIVLPALRLGRPPTGKGSRRGGNLIRDRWIAAVVPVICDRHELSPYRNPLSEHEYGCSIVAKALCRLGIELAETSVEEIYRKHKQA